jgi:ABC-type transport system substrate-binding protein
MAGLRYPPRLTRRAVLRAAAMAMATAGVLAAPAARAAAVIAPQGSMVLAWHTTIAPRWYDRLQHDGSATPDNFLTARQDALIKNYKDQTHDCMALADHFEFVEDARSATFRLREGIKLRDDSAVTPEDVKWSCEHDQGAWAKALHGPL